jgi:hypothetical protein
VHLRDRRGSKHTDRDGDDDRLARNEDDRGRNERGRRSATKSIEGATKKALSIRDEDDRGRNKEGVVDP